MTLWLLTEHLLGFLFPALAVGGVLWLALRTRRPARLGAGTQAWMLAGAGVAVLVAGLLVFGRDGKMLTYAALVLVQGSVAWWLRGR
jgi:hypothetical protein